MQLFIRRPFHSTFGGGKLIDQLEQTVGRNQSRMCGKRFLQIRIDVFLHRIGLRLEHKQIAKINDQIRHESHHVLAVFRLLVKELEGCRGFALQNPPGKIDHGLFARKSENIEDIALADFFPAECDKLIEHRFCIAQTAFRATRDRMRRRRFQRNFFLPGNKLQMLSNQICRDAVEIEALAAAQNSRQNFLRLGGRENKFHMRRRLLERFQKCIKRLR